MPRADIERKQLLPPLLSGRSDMEDIRDRGQEGAANLSVAVIQLLAIALSADVQRPAIAGQERLPIPSDYRRWLAVETKAPPLFGTGVLRCYVCPKGASTPEDQPFPVGTCLVMESSRHSTAKTAGDRAAGSAEQGPTWIFVMKKYETFQHAGGQTERSETWACAAYSQDIAGPLRDA